MLTASRLTTGSLLIVPEGKVCLPLSRQHNSSSFLFVSKLLVRLRAAGAAGHFTPPSCQMFSFFAFGFFRSVPISRVPLPCFSLGYNNIRISELGLTHSRRADREKVHFFCGDAGAAFSSRVQTKGNRISWCFRVRAALKKSKSNFPEMEKFNSGCV